MSWAKVGARHFSIMNEINLLGFQEEDRNHMFQPIFARGPWPETSKASFSNFICPIRLFAVLFTRESEAF